MKIISKTFTLLTVFLLVLGVTGCSDDDDNGPMPPANPNIVEIAVGNANLTNLVAALQAADGDLVSVLSGPGPFTVLAPTDAAFATYLDGTPLDQVDTAVLSQLLLNHVISGTVSAADLASLSDGQGRGYARTNANGAGGQSLSILFDTSGALPRFNNTATVASADLADIIASNGTIHVIDAVLPLPDVVDHALYNDNFTSLTGALTSEDLVTTLQGDGPFTVFAPTNDAFGAFTNPNENALAGILVNHVMSGVTLAADLVNAGSGYANTLANGPLDSNDNMTNLSLYFDTANGVIINGGPEVVVTDIVGTNGVIHVVDNVIDLPTIATFATTNPALATLVEALVFADGGEPTIPFIATVSDITAGPFTVFAPINAAFSNTEEPEGVLQELGLTGFGEDEGQLNAATTDAVLLMHIVSGNIQSSGLPNGDVTTAGGGVITADNTAFTLTDPNDRVTNIVTTLVDIQAVNGVVHVVSKVILPAL